jgi:hypothetical protein
VVKSHKIIISIVLWVGTVLLGGYIGSEWAIKDVPRAELWAGDGIGMMLYGMFGLVIGAGVGAIIVTAFLLIVSRRKPKLHDGDEARP